MTPRRIETGRLRLRDWRIEDCEPFHSYLNTAPVMLWLGGVKAREAHDAIVRDRFMLWQRQRGFTFWVVERKEDDAFLGFCGLKIADDAGSPVEGEMEVGWRFREDVWGKGFAKEAAIASLDFAFQDLGVERVVALTVATNAPSWRLMERLGMTRRPELDYEGPDWAAGIVIVYRIDRVDWRR